MTIDDSKTPKIVDETKRARGGKPVAIEMQPFLRQESFEKAQ